MWHLTVREGESTSAAVHGWSVRPVLGQSDSSRGATARRGEQVGESADRSPRATGQYQDTGVMSNKHGICVGGGAGVGGLTSGGGHVGKQRSMLLNGPACPDIPDILVLSFPDILVLISSTRRLLQRKSGQSGLFSGHSVVLHRGLMRPWRGWRVPCTCW